MAPWDKVFDPDADEEEDGRSPELLGLWRVPDTDGGGDASPPRVALYVGDLAAVPADAVCTSTNPRLSLWAGTGSAVVRRGGWEIKRQAAELVERVRRDTGCEELEPGTVHVTDAGYLPHRAVLHCVASDARHRSSPAIVRRCVEEALVAAASAGCATVAMPIFASGHAGLEVGAAVEAMGNALRDGRPEAAGVEEVRLVISGRERAQRAREVLDGLLEALP